ncbi:carbohydrate ABC transporter substrate-binding protein [Bifidobacterium sp. 82T10]|uniref:Carbohydrate ABC transporter substrate-binding protein n=1 Tax=Bifidobacterium miconis TaxID=2834435 RepID=A0ABS6WDM0_9BIFI|nr:ABC transporter substrate-binding protein [Bifidobacterium miconis]MBW3092138.1 carbohydrate ABC transporter substrate-binding protein [Bifidobacterium miconis]
MAHSWMKLGAAATAAVLSLGMLGACGSSTNSNATTITLFNSKVEIEDQMEDMAKQYSKEKGVTVKVYYSNDTVAAHLATKYASKQPYTISMVDDKDIYSLAKEHAVDLSDEDWVKDTDYALSVDGKVYGFPTTVEARGLIYNADAIKKYTGKDFDPSTIKTTDDLKSIIKELKAGGMKSPVGVLKEDWSLAGHYLPQVYEEQSDVDAFVDTLLKGTADLQNNEKWNSLMDTFDVLKDNNYAKSSAVSAEREVTEQKLAEGEIAFMFGGNWDWSVLNQYDVSENMGMMPVPQNMDDGANEKLVGGGSKFMFIDSSDQTTDAQRQAAKDFLNWLANDKEGQKFIVEDCSLVSPFKTNTLEVQDPLSKSVKKYADEGKLIPNYSHLPDDHYSVLGAEMQKYLADQEDRDALATNIQTYWKTAKLSGATA